LHKGELKTKKGNRGSARRAPLEKGRNGLMKAHGYFHSNADERLQERIDDLDAINHAPMLQIFCEQNLAARLAGRANDQGIP